MSNRKVRWAIVGLGDIVRKRVGSAILAQPDSTLHACVTRNPAARQEDLRHLAPTKVFVDFDQMLADPQVDAVYLATPTFLHAPHATAAMEAGKHVLVEKPMAMNAQEASLMCEASQRTGRKLAVAYYRRFWASFERIKRLLDENRLGQVVLVRVALHSWYRPDPDQPGAWRVNPGLSGGGVISDVGCHRLDLLAWWFGLPKRLVASVQSQEQPDAADEAIAALMVFNNGAHCTAAFHWNSKTWTDEIHVVGTEARATIQPVDGDEVLLSVGRDTERISTPRPQNLHYPLVDDFARAIIEDRPPRFTSADGRQATQMIDAIFRAARTAAWVEGCEA